jgi:hypothetical protein
MSKKSSGNKKTVSETRLTVVQVAAKIRRGYQAARNLMLHGTFGPSHYDEQTRRLTVPASGVAAYIAAQKKQIAPTEQSA